MSDWTYEMLRYAFSWNDESSEKALKYVVTGRSPSESMSEFQSLVAESLWEVESGFWDTNLAINVDMLLITFNNPRKH